MPSATPTAPTTRGNVQLFGRFGEDTRKGVFAPVAGVNAFIDERLDPETYFEKLEALIISLPSSLAARLGRVMILKRDPDNEVRCYGLAHPRLGLALFAEGGDPAKELPQSLFDHEAGHQAGGKDQGPPADLREEWICAMGSDARSCGRLIVQGAGRLGPIWLGAPAISGYANDYEGDLRVIEDWAESISLRLCEWRLGRPLLDAAAARRVSGYPYARALRFGDIWPERERILRRFIPELG